MSQGFERNAPPTEENINHIRSIIDNNKMCMLTSIDPDTGKLHSRPMYTVFKDSDFLGNRTLYFFTHRSSHKMKETGQFQSRDVNLSFSGDKTWLSLTGTGQISLDRAKMQQLWSPALKPWFAGGLEDPDLALIQVQVDSAEYWDSLSSMKTLMGKAKAKLSGAPSQQSAQHQQVNLAGMGTGIGSGTSFGTSSSGFGTSTGTSSTGFGTSTGTGVGAHHLGSGSTVGSGSTFGTGQRMGTSNLGSGVGTGIGSGVGTSGFGSGLGTSGQHAGTGFGSSSGGTGSSSGLGTKDLNRDLKKEKMFAGGHQGGVVEGVVQGAQGIASQGIPSQGLASQGGIPSQGIASQGGIPSQGLASQSFNKVPGSDIQGGNLNWSGNSADRSIDSTSQRRI